MRRATQHGRERCQERVISIHALHEESDRLAGQALTLAGIFQSTLSMRRATHLPRCSPSVLLFQSTLSMRRATGSRLIDFHDLKFQSTLSMRRATCPVTDQFGDQQQFQSTLSMRRATRHHRRRSRHTVISIHALHEESDIILSALARRSSNFNPRSP